MLRAGRRPAPEKIVDQKLLSTEVPEAIVNKPIPVRNAANLAAAPWHYPAPATAQAVIAHAIEKSSRIALA
jgi:hypothetical protein